MNDLKIIKKHYGEKMAHLCRELFPSLLETPGFLSKLLLEHFQPTKFLYDDLVGSKKIEDFKNYIYSLIDVEKGNEVIINKTPKELLDEAGYILYECKTEEEIQEFEKYYALGEELCTFNGGRLNSCYVFFAVKKNVGDIRREDFPNPRREDEYGTSVISIQFRKGNINTLSIKNRYNHTVNNPDNTFNNNLDNIIPGLNDSFARVYNYNFSTDIDEFELPNYVNVNGKYYKYNYEINNVYYCPNNIIIDNFKVIDKYSKEPERYIVLDYFIIDLKEKTIKLYDSNLIDGFTNEYKNIENIIITKNKEAGNKSIEIIYDGGKKATLIINNKNQLIEYHNSFLLKAEDNFLEKVETLAIFEAPNLTEIGNFCLPCMNSLTNLELPNLTKMGNNCFRNVKSLIRLELPNLTKIGDECFNEVKSLIRLELPNLTKMGNNCFRNVKSLIRLELPNLEKIGYECFQEVNSLTNVDLPNLIEMGDFCFTASDSLTNLELPKLTKMGVRCFWYAESLTNLSLPNLTEMGYGCFRNSKLLTNLELSNLKEMEHECFFYADSLTSLSLPNLTKMDSRCFRYLNSLKNLSIPNLIEMGEESFGRALSLISLSLPKLTKMGPRCFNLVSFLTSIELSNLTTMGSECFQYANSLTGLDLPNLIKMGGGCFQNANSLTSTALPNLIRMGSECFKTVKELKSINAPALAPKEKPQSFVEVEKISNRLKYQINKIIKSATYKFEKFRGNKNEASIELRRK